MEGQTIQLSKEKGAVDRRTDNTLVKRKRTKKQTMDKIIHRTPHIE